MHGRVCYGPSLYGRLCYGPSLYWAEFAMGRGVQLPFTTVDSNSFLSLIDKKSHSCKFGII